MVHQRLGFDKAFMQQGAKTPHCRWYLRQGCCGRHSSKCSWTWSEQTGSLFRSTRWDKGFHGCIRSLVDRGDSGHQFLKWVMDCLGWMIQVVLRQQQTQGFVLLKKRSVVEQTFGLLNWYRRLSKDDRRLPASSHPTIYISLIRLIALVSLSEDYNQ